MTFNVDDHFSKHKDILLKCLWEQLSYEGRFVLVQNKHLQKHCGIDVILQGKDDFYEIPIDNKHRRGDPVGAFGDFLLEDLSNTRTKPPRLGWARDPEKITKKVYYCCWLDCSNCYEDCFECPKRLEVIVWGFDYPKLREWFNQYHSRYPERYNKEYNQTLNRAVPVEDGATFFDATYEGRFNLLPLSQIDWTNVLGGKEGQISLEDYSLSELGGD